MKKFRKVSFRTLAVILSVLMVVYLLPLSVFAAEVYESGEKVEGSNEEYGSTGYHAVNLGSDMEPDAICEDDNLRQANIKYFLMDDGSYTAAVYPGAVHYLDGNGNWQDIDNTLSASGSEYSTSNARIKFAKKITGNETLFTLHDGNRKITMSLDGAIKKTAGQVTNTEPERGETTKLQKLMTLNKLSSEVLYADILDGVDLEYVLNGGDIKENIIVKEKKDTYSYSFTLSLNNLEAELVGDEVILKDGDETFYTIPAPYMYDAEGAYSDAAEYTLADHGNGKYTLTVTADKDWMNADDRAFPVTIDPPIEKETSLVVSFTHASIDSENYNTNTMHKLYVGHREYNKQYRGYIVISGITALVDPAGIEEVKLGYRQESFIWHEQENTDSDIEELTVVLRPTYAWYSTLCWDSQPALKSYDMSFNSANGTSTGNYCYWDITDIFIDEINEADSNCYLMMQTYNDSNGTADDKWRSFYTGEYGVSAPSLTIKYKSLTGLESHWTTTDHSAGFAGNGYVNNRTGELTFAINTLSTIDSLMPTGFPLIYNSSYANSFVTSENSALSNSSAIAGKGLKLGLHETVSPYTIQNTQYYIYTDLDGTEHLFKSAGNIYEDMDGMGLKLTVNTAASSYTITDRAGYVYTHTILNGSGRGYLTDITTPDGNTLMIEYGDTNPGPSQIKLKPYGQSAFVQMEIEYNTSGLVSRVFNPHTYEAYIFYYSTTYSGSSYSRDYSGFLRKMVYVKGTENTTAAEWSSYLPTTTSETITKIAEATYSYDSSGRLITARDELSNQEIRYTYDSYGKVSTVTEYAGSIQGQKIGFTYLSDATKVQSSGTDDVYGTGDDLYMNYVFDSRGRTVNAYTTDYTGTVLYGTSSVQYESENEKAKNNVKFGISTSGIYPNLLYNGTFETKGSSSGTIPGWTKSGNVTHIIGNYEFDSGTAQLSGSGATIYQDVTLETGKHSLSFIATSGGDVTGLNVKVERIVGGTVILNEVLTKSNMDADSLSSNFGYIFEVASEGSYRISFTFNGASDAIISLDNVMLTKSSVVSQMSYLEDGGFEESSLGAWSSYSTADGGSIFGSSAKIGDGTTYNTIENKVFTITDTVSYENLPTIEGTVMTLYGWAKKSDIYNYNGNFRMQVKVKYDLGSSYTTDTFTYDFLKDTNGWQYGSVSFELQSGRLVEISVILEYSCSYGEVWYDGIVLTSDESQLTVYEYNPAGLVSYARSGYDQSWYYYNTNNDLVMNVNTKLGGKGSILTYEYSNRRIIREAQYSFRGGFDSDIKNIRGTYFACTSFTNYSYNQFGLPTNSVTFAPGSTGNGVNVSSISVGGHTVSSTLSGGGINFANYSVSSDEHIQSKTTYKIDGGSPNFGAVVETEDSLGSKTNYFYCDDYRLSAVIYPDGTGLSYSYDAKGNTSTVLPAKYVGTVPSSVTNSASVTYEYDEANRLKKISTDTTEYTFEYDSFGNTTEISAGSNTLASYTYNTGNGKLSTLTYGNGDSVRYTYDELDRIEQIEYNNGTGYVTAVKYVYNADGNVYLIQDMLAGEVTQFSYDSTGRITGSSKRSASGSEIYAEKRVKYDTDDRVSSLRYNIGDSESVWSYYTYDSRSRLSQYKLISEPLVVTTGITYDAFNRPTGKATTINFLNTTAFEVSQSYDYKESGYSQSALVSRFTSNFDGNTTIYNIAYDDMGNITSISDNAGVVQNRYEYDDLGQLVREDNRALGKSYTYTYDKAGNILSKKVYNFTLGTLGTPIDTISYSYSGDRLTSYDGQSITYDSIGNPLTYRGNTLTWRNGRELASYGNYTFTYNSDGIRTSKTIGSNMTEYTVDGSTVLRQSWNNGSDSYTADYLYDENGNPFGFIYRKNGGTASYYFYETNIFGDIAAVYNSNGSKIVSFTYDAWGNVTQTISNTTVCTDDFIKATLFRYRGYIYDSETNLYYLQSRYYDPEVGRFISADGYINANGDLLGYNMYAYCSNNPVMYVDPTGEVIGTAILVGIISGAIIGGAIGGTASYKTAKSSGVKGADLFWETLKGIGNGVLIGGLAGGLIGSAVGVVMAYGAASVAGTAMITSTLSVAAKATEVVVLQTRKTINETDNSWQAVNNSMNALINNRDKVLSPYVYKAGITTVTYKLQNFINPLSYKDFFKSSQGKVLAYGFVAWAWADTIKTLLSDDPISRAEERGYTLE